MRRSCLILFILFSLTLVGQTSSDNKMARIPTKTLIDTSYMEVIYCHKIYDDYQKFQKDFFDILQIGKNHCFYYNYGYYKRDSIIDIDYPNGLTRFQFYALGEKTHPQQDIEIVRNLQTGEMTCYDKVFIDNYFYEETLPEMKWTLLPTYEEICGFKCYQATTTFRGRKWTAWYCDDIPLNNGPWKFNGLPGVILKAQDITGEHIFEAISIRKSDRPFGPKKKNRLKTDRKKFNEMKKNYKWKLSDMSIDPNLIPRDKDGKPISGSRRLFYVPIELD